MLGRILNVWLGGVAGMLACAPALSSDRLSPHLFNGQIEAQALLPGGAWSVMQIRDRSGLFFLSQNGRYAIRGDIVDLWTGEALNSVSAVSASSETMPLPGLQDAIDDLEPVEFGAGVREVTVFTDPMCPACEAMLGQLTAYTKSHRFNVVQIPLLGKRSGQMIRMYHCAADRTAARNAVLSGMPPDLTLSQLADCDPRALHRRLVVGQMLGISGVPFLLSSDGRVFQGTRDDLHIWLKEL